MYISPPKINVFSVRCTFTVLRQLCNLYMYTVVLMGVDKTDFMHKEICVIPLDPCSMNQFPHPTI